MKTQIQHKEVRISVLRYYLVALTLVMIVQDMRSDERLWHCEFGIDGGCGYYVGDAEEHIFQNVCETYGANFRYMFDQRWTIRVKGMAHRIKGYQPNRYSLPDKSLGMWTNQMVNIDVVGEFNFFRFGDRATNMQLFPITPYMALGLGASLHSKWKKVSVYMPFIMGAKWRCSQNIELHLAWQNNVYFADNIEGVKSYDNRYDLNGGNLMNVDVTGQLVAGIAIVFARDRRVCRNCW